jgi:hypothetical protein
LRILPKTARRLEPREILALDSGDAEQWHKAALLAQWVAWQVVMSIPSMTKEGANEKRKLSNFVEYCKKQPSPLLIRERLDPKKPKKK